MKNLLKILAMLIVIIGLVTINSCKNDDEEAPALTLSTLMANNADLNGATAPSDVDLDAVITASFSTEIDAMTATITNISLIREYDDQDLTINISASGKNVTITPLEPFGTGTMYTLNIGVGLTSQGGKNLSQPITRSFTTLGTFVVPGAIAQWTFEDNANDVIGNHNPSANGIVDITYDASRNDASGMAATFNGSTSIIEIPNGDQLMNTDDFTLSFWVKTNSTDKTSGHFVMGLGAFYGFQFEIFGDYGGCKLAASYEYNKNDTLGGFSEDLWCDATGNLGWQGWVYSKDMSGSGGLAALIKDQWAHIVCVYNSTTKQGIMYINGERVKEQDFDLWPDGANQRYTTGLKYRGEAPEVVNDLAFGFIQSRAGELWDAETWGGYDFPEANHFKGQLDDIIIYHKVLTPEEITLMYNSGS